MQKKPTLYVLINHTLFAEQVSDAYKHLGVDEIAYFPEEALKVWGNISPHVNYIKDKLYPIYDYMNKTCEEGDYLLVQGDSGATFQVVQKALSLKLIPVYATTKRQAVEKFVDGKSIKTSVFKHVMYRKYRV